jgi:enoyl-[acyl-carrier protein] reductase II
MIKTPLCDLLEIEYPILQEAWHGSRRHRLPLPCQNAGDSVLLPRMNADAEWLRKEIRKTKSLTDKPFGVNIMLMSPFADEVAQ